MANRVFRFVALTALIVGGLKGATACSDSSPRAEPVAEAITNGLAPSNGQSHHKVGQFVGHVDHAKQQFVIERLGAPIVLGDNLEPTSVDSLSQNQFVLDDGGGTPVPNTVDLVTTAYNDKPAQHTFTADVELRSFYTRSFANVYVQIAGVTLDGGTISGYDGTNSVGSNSLGLDATHGLWSYSANDGSDGGSFLAANPNAKTNNGRWADKQTWKFANANDENIVYTIDVWASAFFSKYTQGFGTASYVDVCDLDGGGKITTDNKKNSINLPFDFTIYSTNTSTVSMGDDGILAFGADVTNTNANVALPSPSAQGPAFFPFWDNLVSAADGGVLCWGSYGTQPNLVEALEWKNMQVAAGKGAGATLDFEVLLHEGTGEIDTVYNSMVAAPGDTSGRESGKKATVGIQNENGTLATAEFNTADFGTGKGYTYIPSP